VKIETVMFFNTKLTMFSFHFQLYTTLQLPSAHQIDWEAVKAFTAREIIQCPRSDELLMSAQHMFCQCDHAYRVLHIEHRPGVPCSVIAKATLCRHCKQYWVNATSLSQTDTRRLCHMSREMTSLKISGLHWLITDRGQRQKSEIGSNQPIKNDEADFSRHLLRRDQHMKAWNSAQMEKSGFTILRLIFINWSRLWMGLLLALVLMLLRWIIKGERTAKKRHNTDHQIGLMMRFPSLFCDETGESLLLLGAESMTLF
jgi:hypothetical protein